MQEDRMGEIDRRLRDLSADEATPPHTHTPRTHADARHRDPWPGGGRSSSPDAAEGGLPRPA